MNTREQAARHSLEWRWSGLRVGMASGAFDLFHAGHLSFLTGIRGHCDRLIVAVMDDDGCRRKGAGRPIIPQAERVAIVSALQCVDDAFIFTEYGDDANLLSIRPHVFGRGDGHGRIMHEGESIVELGTDVILIHTPRITSTTEIIHRIKNE